MTAPGNQAAGEKPSRVAFNDGCDLLRRVVLLWWARDNDDIPSQAMTAGSGGRATAVTA